LGWSAAGVVETPSRVPSAGPLRVLPWFTCPSRRGRPPGGDPSTNEAALTTSAGEAFEPWTFALERVTGNDPVLVGRPRLLLGIRPRARARPASEVVAISATSKSKLFTRVGDPSPSIPCSSRLGEPTGTTGCSVSLSITAVQGRAARQSVPGSRHQNCKLFF
jgi:hypothetical protein